MKNFIYDKDSFGKMYGNNQNASYVFEAEIQGEKNTYIVEVINYKLANLIMANIPAPLIHNGMVTEYVEEGQIESYENLFWEVELYLKEYHLKLLN